MRGRHLNVKGACAGQLLVFFLRGLLLKHKVVPAGVEHVLELGAVEQLKHLGEWDEQEATPDALREEHLGVVAEGDEHVLGGDLHLARRRHDMNGVVVRNQLEDCFIQSMLGALVLAITHVECDIRRCSLLGLFCMWLEAMCT